MVDGMGTQTNPRFADDIILVASSRGNIGKMIGNLSDRAAVYGLRLRMGKTNILTNVHAAPSRRKLIIHGKEVEVLPVDAKEKYLGCTLCATDGVAYENEHRIAQAWKSFSLDKDELCNQKLCKRTRVKPFESVVTSRALYGSAAWTLTKAHEHMRTKNRRQMLRKMFGRCLSKSHGKATSWKPHRKPSTFT